MRCVGRKWNSRIPECKGQCWTNLRVVKITDSSIRSLLKIDHTNFAVPQEQTNKRAKNVSRCKETINPFFS